tara:strand:- start:67 stop:579 length:513 start_codon:yes stop_codon:yes gene_type:complete
MQDVSSGFGMWFYFVIAFPIIIYFLGAMFRSLPDGSSAPARKVQPVKNTGESFLDSWTQPSISISLSFPNVKTTPAKSKKPKKTTPKRAAPKRAAPKRAKPAPPKRATVSKKAPEMGTDKAIISDVVAGLANLGVKKGQAKLLVNSLCKKNKYTSSESLLDACFVCIKSD